ncbi:hypothetical protein NL676_007231 [Syzygium grande]|nr:hypothetical protein NL676_007231 [Syzygium grande]
MLTEGLAQRGGLAAHGNGVCKAVVLGSHSGKKYGEISGFLLGYSDEIPGFLLRHSVEKYGEISGFLLGYSDEVPDFSSCTWMRYMVRYPVSPGILSMRYLVFFSSTRDEIPGFLLGHSIEKYGEISGFFLGYSDDIPGFLLGHFG